MKGVFGDCCCILFFSNKARSISFISERKFPLFVAKEVIFFFTFSTVYLLWHPLRSPPDHFHTNTDCWECMLHCCSIEIINRGSCSRSSLTGVQVKKKRQKSFFLFFSLGENWKAREMIPLHLFCCGSIRSRELQIRLSLRCKSWPSAVQGNFILHYGSRYI